MTKQLSYADQKSINFKSIGQLEADMTVNANEVTWYEAGLYKEEAVITTSAPARIYLITSTALCTPVVAANERFTFPYNKAIHNKGNLISLDSL
mgnify:CR=1 FL=1